MARTPQKIEILFQPMGKKARAGRKATLLEIAQNAGIGLSAVCGGRGTCGTCRVKLSPGAAASSAGEVEKGILGEASLRAGFRLACQCRALKSLEVDVPLESLAGMQRTLLQGEETPMGTDPAVQALEVTVLPPSQEDLRSDWSRLLHCLAEKVTKRPFRTNPLVLGELSEVLRKSGWKVKVLVRNEKVVAVGSSDLKPLGLAVDLGTSKLAAYLVDLEERRTLAMAGSMNPQIGFGEDVMARIAFAMKGEEARKVLQHSVVEGVNGLIHRLLQEAGLSGEGLVDGVIAGNTAMHHMLLGLPVKQLGQAPYVPAFSDPLDLDASHLGLDMAKGARIHLFPNIAGFVGGDHVAVILATSLREAWGIKLGIDIGTNTEITLCARGRLLSCSCASGPAFEGARIHHGMRAAEGAIERICLQGEEILFQTVGGVPPVGICGSGVLDAVAQLRQGEVIDGTGRMGPHSLVRKGERGPEVVLVPAEKSGHGREIVFQRRDVGEIQLAKGAIRAGIDVLLNRAELEERDVEEIIIAGAFGTYLDIRSSITVGMFPPLPVERFRQVGNAAGTGARRALLSREEREEAALIARKVEYVELTGNPFFSQAFSKRMVL